MDITYNKRKKLILTWLNLIFKNNQCFYFKTIILTSQNNNNNNINIKICLRFKKLFENK